MKYKVGQRVMLKPYNSSYDYYDCGCNEEMVEVFGKYATIHAIEEDYFKITEDDHRWVYEYSWIKPEIFNDEDMITL
jgi:hypothetical protein